MILFFSYFWVATQFNELQIADDLKKNGGYIPGVRPGQATSDYLHNAMSRITLGWRDLPDRHRGHPDHAGNQMNIPYPRGAVFRRHQHADHGRRDAGYHAPDGNASADAALRRVFEEGPAQRAVLSMVAPFECCSGGLRFEGAR